MDNEKSKFFYVCLEGDYALFTNPTTKGGGENVSCNAPSRQALNGIVDAIYYKPTIVNIIDEVKVINPIQTETMGSRMLLNNMGADLNYVTYLRDVKYLVKYHFEWNLTREDLKQDRNMKKHEAIAERSIQRGGRRDVFLGTRECVGLVTGITKEDYDNAQGAYFNQTISFGLQFHSFIYPKSSKEKLKSCYTETVMKDSTIVFKNQEDCEVINELSTYSFKESSQFKDVGTEYEEYENF
ncbi:type I-C CRISPR-associated protein Cas5c [Ligilactobacillus sp. Marseille-Q7487]|uniref:type I-C CRISPR-associated protein Cas5c n=1 Tax=Ligilactobacillus sp. Marseille-Q7487 TaxID=3022128 RepID=UPI0024A9C67D|nr:type I-C CRISPR-associated protein Cas5c [Ligilactobacillus sp. Marseille-Q7487]